MPTFTLNGFTLGLNESYAGPTSVTIALPENYVFQHEYSNNANNPGFASIPLFEFGITLPEAFFDPALNSPAGVAPYGNNDNDSAFFFDLTLSNGTQLTVLVIYDSVADLQHNFILDSTAPFSLPQNQSQLNALLSQVTSGGLVTTGPFAPGVNIDFEQVVAPTLGAASDNDAWTGTDDDEGFDGGIGNDTLDGGAGNDSLVGGAGDDDLIGGAGNDTIIAGDGDRDEVWGLAGNDSLNGGAGTRDDLRYDRDAQNGGMNGVNVNLATGIAIDGFGDTDTFSGFERVRGTQFNDTLIGDDGRNQLRGMGGSDFIDGGSGTDAVAYFNSNSAVSVNLATGLGIHGTGVDTLVSIEEILGSNFDDTLIGNAGDNYLEGGFGNDSIDGGAGFDVIGYFETNVGVNANLATGIVTGGEGTDTIIDIEGVEGSSGNDTLTGNDVGNFLNGRDGNDSIDGGGGDDDLRGGAGNDTLRGGDGRDNLQGGLGDDLLDGGAGDGDAADYFNASGGVTVNLAIGRAFGADGNDTLIGIERVWGSFYDDTITGDGNRNIIQGRGGNDVLDGGAGFDAVDYFDANGGVNVNLATGLVSGAAGNDTISNFEEVFGSFLDDTITGDASDNFIQGRRGNDILNGGAGIDAVDYFGAEGAVTVNLVTNRASGADGNDTLSNFEWIFGSFFNDNLIGDDGDNVIQGRDGNDSLSGNGGDDFLDGGVGNDTLRGGGGFDQLTGGVGDDLIDGGVNADTLVGNGGNDTLLGGFGFDQLFGGFGNDDLYGGGDNDTLYGFEGFDRLFGEQGNDLLFGEGGNDALFGGFGNDRLFGGNGNDFLDGFFGDDTLLGEQGNDVINAGDGNDRVLAGSGDDRVFGGNGNDVIFGWLGNDRIFGQQGNDTIFGEGGNDLIDGGAGNDVLNGGAGMDTIFGWGGDDRMTGGADADVFVFANGSGRDTITDFQVNVVGEVIDLSLVSSITNMVQLNTAAVNTANGVVITLSAGNTILLEGLTENQLSADDFIFI